MNKQLHLKKWAFGLSLFLGIGGTLNSQVQLNQLVDFGTPIIDINSQGHGLHYSGYYDFATNTSTLPEPEIGGTSAINDAGTVLGMMDDGEGNLTPAMRVGGVWTPFPAGVGIGPNDTFYGMSENGVWVVGQTEWNSEDDSAWGFIYNTQTEEFRLLDNPLYEYSAAYGVNNDGVAVGWVDDLPEGTLRMPAIFNADGSVTLMGNDSGEGSAISNNGLIVGSYSGLPFIYDITAGTMQTFTVSDDAFGGAFADISETGVAIGYITLPGFARIPIIYHSFLGSNPVLLSDILSQFGVDGEGITGTGNKISPDGNYVGGFSDGPAFMAMGWAVYFNDQLLVEPECSIDCPSNIEMTVEYGELGVPVIYEMTYSCEEEEPEGLEIVQVNGLPSGAEFPIGTTNNYFELRDGEGNVVHSCGFKVIVNDTYCTTAFEVEAEPITFVEFQEIENATSVSSTTTNEFFLDMVANVNQAGTYPINVRGYTGGPYTNYVNVFIDWNRNGSFEPNETYHVGALFNSTGEDAQQVSTTIQVPANAAIGLTRMRVVKSYGGNPNNPCDTYFYGQTEDYGIMVGSGTPSGEEDNCTKSNPSNHFENALGPLAEYVMANDFVVPAGESFSVEQITMNIWLDPETTVTSADIYLFQDSGSGPGDELVSENGLIPSSIVNVGGDMGFIAYEVTFELTNPLILNANTANTIYWIGAQAYSTGSNVFWEVTSAITSPYEQYYFDTDEQTWVTNTSVFEFAADGVFKISGECGVIVSSGDIHSTDLNIYPNPVSEMLFIQTNEKVNSLEVLSLTGQQFIYTETMIDGNLNLSSLASGVYMVRVNFNNGQTQSLKLVKQ